MQLREYQEKLVSAVVADLQQPMEVCLAASPGAGKTVMAITIIDRLIAAGTIRRALVLTHGQSLLRNQFGSQLEGIAVGFTWSELYPGRAMPDDQAVIALPQSLHRRELPAFDLVVVDEAHEFYHADMVQGILKRCGASRILALTGTPSPFVERGVKIHALGLSDLYDLGYAHPTDILLASSAYPIELSDYNEDGEVRAQFKYERTKTKQSMDALLEELARHEGGDVSWSSVLTSLQKTLFVCRSRAQAGQIVDHLKRRGVIALLSTAEDDADGEQIERFKTLPAARAMVVVRRGSIGFDFPELVNLVDMTGTMNLNRIFQMLCRLVRKHPRRTAPKLFIRLTTDGMRELTQAYTSGACSLMERDALLAYNGRDLSGVRCVVRTTAAGTTEVGTGGSGGNGETPKHAPAWMSLFDDFRPVLRGDGGRLAYAVRSLLSERGRIVPGAQDPLGRKSAIKAWYAEHGRLPSSGERLYPHMARYCSKSSGSAYDMDFHGWAAERGYFARKCEHGIAEIRAFYDENHRLPKYGERFHNRMMKYCNDKNKYFNKEFYEWARERGFIRANDVKQSKEAIKLYYLKHGELPRSKHGLYSRLFAYCSKASSLYDSEFAAWAKDRGCGKYYKLKAEQTKAEIKKWYDEHGELPKRPNKLYSRMIRYLDRKGKHYEKDFFAWAVKCGYRPYKRGSKVSVSHG